VKSYPVKVQDSIMSYTSYLGNNTFKFLNKEHCFEEKIDWNFQEYGNLWAYNLNYFEFLHQQHFNKQEGLAFIHDFVNRKNDIRAGLAPYPISLRNIFWIRFLIKNHLQDEKIDAFLYATYKVLSTHLEYHLLGNHLLENAFSLLFGAYYFQDKKLYHKAKNILKRELQEQISEDGAHFELSPMYHSIMLYRVLDCYNLVVNNVVFEQELKDLLREKGEKMLAWLNEVTFSNGDIPLVNDAAFGIAPTPQQLNEYALRLGLNCTKTVILKESGYRKFKTDKFELLVDIGQIGPDYQLGHAHADTFNFVLYANNRPVIVDAGTSTYEVNKIRFYERSTAAHNTVVLLGRNSSEVWGGHRVARRAKVYIIEENGCSILAQHNGYRSMGIIHQRTWNLNDEKVVIEDSLIDNEVNSHLPGCIAKFHLDGSIKNITVVGNTIAWQGCTMIMTGAEKIEVREYEQAIGFNNRVPAKCIVAPFKHGMTTTILS
jgi:hypothetical protein